LVQKHRHFCRGEAGPADEVELWTENVTIFDLMATAQIARRFFVSGIVQGVGFRYFTQDEAERLHLAGFVRNLRDGRVEVYAIGSQENLARLRSAVERGPRGAMVQRVAEESAELDTKFAQEFNITYDH
jgi:acylphosphatase